MTMMSNYNKRQCGQPGQTGVLALLAVLLMTLFVLNSVPGVEARQVKQIVSHKVDHSGDAVTIKRTLLHDHDDHSSGDDDEVPMPGNTLVADDNGELDVSPVFKEYLDSLPNVADSLESDGSIDSNMIKAACSGDDDNEQCTIFSAGPDGDLFGTVDDDGQRRFVDCITGADECNVWVIPESVTTEMAEEPEERFLWGLVAREVAKWAIKQVIKDQIKDPIKEHIKDEISS